MKGKVIFLAAAVISAALLFGGLYLLFRDDVGEVIQEKKIKPYRPDMSVFDVAETSENNAENVPDRVAEMPKENMKKIVGQVQQFGEKFDNSIGWIYVPDTKINYPIMFSGDNDYYLHRAVDGCVTALDRRVC